MKKAMKLVSLVLAVVMLLGCLTACGSKSATTDATASTDTASNDTAAASDGGEIVIALISNTTGDYAQYGQPVRDGAMLYINQLNAITAYFYMKGLDYFGGMPIYHSVNDGLRPRNTALETYRHVETLLKNAIPALAKKSSLGAPEDGYIKQAAAAAMPATMASAEEPMPRACGMLLCACRMNPTRPRPKVWHARRNVETTRCVSSRGRVSSPSPSIITCAAVFTGSALSVNSSSSW